MAQDNGTTETKRRRKNPSHQEMVESLRERLKYNTVLPGVIFTKAWAEGDGLETKGIHNTYQLLGILSCTVDWKTGLWFGRITVLAEVMGVTPKTVENWIRQLHKGLPDFEWYQGRNSIEIQLPKWLIPSHLVEKHKKSRTEKNLPSTENPSTRTVKPFYQNRNLRENSSGFTRLGDMFNG